MKIKNLLAILISISFILFATTSFATDNTMDNIGNNIGNGMQNILSGAGNGIRNVVNGTGNIVEDIAGGIGQGFNNMTSENETENQNSTYGGIMSDTNNNNYNATRTATGANTTNGTFLGMDATTWGWFIMAIVGVLIVGFVWFYGKQHEDGYKTKHDDNY